jgi:hypothetical protein
MFHDQRSARSLLTGKAQSIQPSPDSGAFGRVPLVRRLLRATRRPVWASPAKGSIGLVRARHLNRASDVGVPGKSVRRDGRRLRLLSLLMVAVAVAIAIVGLLTVSVPSVPAILLFGGTMAAAEHRDRLFGDETSVSGSIAVAMATVLVFARGSWLTGPMVCAGLAGFYWPHIRARAWSRVAVNAAAMSLAAAGAATVIHVLVATDVFDTQLALAGVIGLGMFWTVNSLMLAVAVSSIQERHVVATTWQLLRSDIGLLPFGYLGFLTGLLAKGGLVDVWLALLAVLVLLDRTVIHVPQRTSNGPLIVSATAIGFTTIGLVLATTNTPSANATIPLLCAGGLVLSSSVEDLRRGSVFGVAVASAVAAAIAMQGTQPVVAPLLVGVATCLPALVQSRSVRAVARAVCSTAAASVSIGATAVVYQRIGGALLPAVTFGVIAGATALLVWHATLGAWLLMERKQGLARSAFDVFVADAPIAIVAGVAGGAAGWGSLDASTSDVVLIALLTFLVVRAVSALLRTKIRPRLADDDLLDIVRSAVLDLPASKPPDEGTR